jgi:hypothetical protein
MKPIKLLEDSLARSYEVYGQLLILTSPNLIFVLLSLWIQSQAVLITIYLVYFSLVFPSVWGATIFYTYHHFLGQKISIKEALRKGIKSYNQLLWGSILFFMIFISGFILLIIPAIYLSTRVRFYPYFIVIQNCSATQGISRSWKIVRGFWWSVFMAIVVEVLVFGYFFGYQINKVIAELQLWIGATYTEMFARTLWFMVSPISIVYGVLLFKELQAIKQSNRR